METKVYRKKLNLGEQLISLKNTYSTHYKAELKHGMLIWEQPVKPSNLSKTYTITVKYNGQVPEVYIYNQGIVKSKNDPIPHCYKKKYSSKNKEYVQICLFYPKSKEWNQTLYLSKTIIPWAIDWLHYYETWRITGQWLGGGIDHEKNTISN